MVFCYYDSMDTGGQSLTHSVGFSPRGSCQHGTHEMPPDHCGPCLQFRKDGGKGWLHSLIPAPCCRMGRASVDNDNEPGPPHPQPLFCESSYTSGSPTFPALQCWPHGQLVRKTKENLLILCLAPVPQSRGMQDHITANRKWL